MKIEIKVGDIYILAEDSVFSEGPSYAWRKVPEFDDAFKTVKSAVFEFSVLLTSREKIKEN